MNKISKFKLENVDQETIDIPLPARILSVVEKDNDIVLYAITDDDKDVPTIPVDILILGTGEVAEDNIGIYTFLGTVKLSEFWHVFYRYRHFGHDHVVIQSDKLPVIEERKEEYNIGDSRKGDALVLGY